MTYVVEIIVAAVLRSLCFLHFHKFQILHENLPLIETRFGELHPKAPVIQEILGMFPAYPHTMTIPRWEALHALATDLATMEHFGELFYLWSAYAINSITHCASCEAFSTPNPQEAVRLRNNQVFVSSLQTLDRRTIVNTTRNYPSCADEYMDSSRFTGEYHRMEMALKKTRRKLSRCRERVADQSQSLVEMDAERHQLRQQNIELEIRNEHLTREVARLLRIVTWGPPGQPINPPVQDEHSEMASNAPDDTDEDM